MSSDARRGERLYPPRGAPNQFVLTRLREALEDVIATHREAMHGARLLDFGCGDMPYRPLFEAAGASYEGHDLPGNGRADRHIGPGGELDCAPGGADIVLSSQVLEHVEDPARYLAESHRVLRQGGLLVLSTHGVWPYHPDPLDYWRWTGPGLRRLVKQSGFEVVGFHGIAGPAATAIQLWQNQRLKRLPAPLQPAYCRYQQWRMRRADARTGDALRQNDAAVFLCVGSKR